MDKKDYESAIQTCIELGPDTPGVWYHVLEHFAKGNNTDELAQVITLIEEQEILPPLVVIQVLAQYKHIKLGIAKRYLTDHFLESQKTLAENYKQFMDIRKETQKLQEEIHKFQTQSKIFQITECSTCGKPLDLPAVHFMCSHSYHQRCLVEVEQCPKCAPDNINAVKAMREMRKTAKDREGYFKQVCFI